MVSKLTHNRAGAFLPLVRGDRTLRIHRTFLPTLLDDDDLLHNQDNCRVVLVLLLIRVLALAVVLLALVAVLDERLLDLLDDYGLVALHDLRYVFLDDLNHIVIFVIALVLVVLILAVVFGLVVLLRIVPSQRREDGWGGKSGHGIWMPCYEVVWLCRVGMSNYGYYQLASSRQCQERRWYLLRWRSPLRRPAQGQWLW